MKEEKTDVVMTLDEMAEHALKLVVVVLGLEADESSAMTWELSRTREMTPGKEWEAAVRQPGGPAHSEYGPTAFDAADNLITGLNRRAGAELEEAIEALDNAAARVEVLKAAQTVARETR